MLHGEFHSLVALEQVFILWNKEIIVGVLFSEVFSDEENPPGRPMEFAIRYSWQNLCILLHWSSVVVLLTFPMEWSEHLASVRRAVNNNIKCVKK